MRTGIVFKLFLLTSALCLFILAVIFVGQTVFFKQFYVNKKVDNIQASLQSFETAYANSGGDTHAIDKLEEEFYRKHNTWITTVDKLGNLKGTDDFYIEVKLDPDQDHSIAGETITVPLYSLVGAEEISKKNPFLREGERVILNGITVDSAAVTYRVGLGNGNIAWENQQMAKKEHEIIPSFDNPAEEHEEFPSYFLYGHITKVQLPDGNRASRFVYSNHLFIDRVKEFQANLLLGKEKKQPVGLQMIDYEENDVKYKIMIDPIIVGGEPAYVIAMTSLQPVDEAVQMIQAYYVYLILFVMILILLLSFYYSKRIARPLLLINRTTKKIAALDFSEKISIASKDEIGDLSQTINELSDTLHSHIKQLRQDIEKEKQLENTRKEFIAGVSHELKTPLSVIKSCISIVRDGVASHKREHYLEAMENEVNRMDMLIVDMLELAKFESGTYKLKLDAFFIDTVIRQICQQLSLELDKKQLQLHTDLAPVEVIANQHRIEQVITNFLTNAIRYSPEKESISITAMEEEGSVKVCVENKGVHIEKQHLEKIWGRFYRGEPSRQRSKGGTGLGLAICKKILDLHGAAYGVANTAEGVLFYFYLPKKV